MQVLDFSIAVHPRFLMLVIAAALAEILSLPKPLQEMISLAREPT